MKSSRASELAGFANMPCIVRNMTDGNLRHREKLLPSEKAAALQSVGQRNGMSVKTVWRYL